MFLGIIVYLVYVLKIHVYIYDIWYMNWILKYIVCAKLMKISIYARTRVMVKYMEIWHVNGSMRLIMYVNNVCNT